MAELKKVRTYEVELVSYQTNYLINLDRRFCLPALKSRIRGLLSAALLAKEVATSAIIPPTTALLMEPIHAKTSSILPFTNNFVVVNYPS